ncbi:hypothetical protein V1478_002391, partial [Vespula squamosa]
ILEKRSSLSFADFASLGNSLLLFRIVPSNVVRFVNNFVASNALVKKLSVVTRLQHRRTTNSPSGIDEGQKIVYNVFIVGIRCLSQNLMPNLSGLLENNCSSTVKFIS